MLNYVQFVQCLKIVNYLEPVSIEKETEGNEDEKAEDDDNTLKIMGANVPPHEYTRTVLVNFQQKSVSLEIGENFIRKIAPQVMIRCVRSKKKISHFRLTFNTEQESHEVSKNTKLFR